MVALVTSMRSLPADLAITDRSRKFYDGTYKWDSDGFTDEYGVYRQYDCLNPLARAPTPLPPMFPDDEGNDDQIDPANIDIAQSQDNSGTVTSIESAPLEPDTPCQRPDAATTSVRVRQTPGSIRRFAIDLLNRAKQSKAAPQSEVNRSSCNGTNLVSRIEDNVAESEQPDAVKILYRSYELYEGSAAAKSESSSMKMPDTPPDSPVKNVSVLQNTSPASTISTLSPAPSNLSDQDRDEDPKIKGASITRDTPSLPSTPSKAPPPKKKVTTTRGVAQKVAKRSKRASASESSPPKRKEKSVEDFTLRRLHSGSFLREGGLRRSARQAKSEGN